MKRLWTPEEEADLKQIYKTMTAKQLAEHFGRSVHAIQVNYTEDGQEICIDCYEEKKFYEETMKGI